MDHVAIGLGPLLGPLLLTPTLAELRGLAPKREFTLPLGSDFVMEHMVHSQRSVAAGRWWTHFTHAFVHNDLNHLVGNLSMLVPSAIAVAQGYGAWSTWLTFFGGCAAGTLNLGDMKNRQRANQIRNMLQPAGAAAGAPQAVAQFWGKGADWAAEKLAPIVTSYAGYVGCSAGCCALLGLDFCTSVAALWQSLCSNRASKQVSMDSESVEEISFRATSHILSVYFTLKVVGEQLAAVQSGAAGSVDNAAHLIGFGFGVGCFALFSLRRKLLHF